MSLCVKLRRYSEVGGFALKIKYLFVVILSLVVCGLASAQNFAQSTTPDNVPTRSNYLLGPGDKITVKVLNEEQFGFSSVVSEDGKVEVPFNDKTVVAKCRTEKDVRNDIKTLLGKYLKEPQISLQTEKNSRQPAMIYGEVNRPMDNILLYRKATLREIISMAAGPKEEAGGTIQIFRTQAPMCSEREEADNWKASENDPNGVPSRMFSLADLNAGKEGADPTIYPGDVIFVHRALPVCINGEVVAPQCMYLKEGGLSLTQAIAKLGGIRPEAKTKEIKIQRLNSKVPTGIEVLTANYDQITTGKQKDLMLQPNDIVVVDKAKDSVGMQIFKFAIGVGKAGITAVGTGGGYRVLY